MTSLRRVTKGRNKLRSKYQRTKKKIKKEYPSWDSVRSYPPKSNGIYHGSEHANSNPNLENEMSREKHIFSHQSSKPHQSKECQSDRQGPHMLANSQSTFRRRCL